MDTLAVRGIVADDDRVSGIRLTVLASASRLIQYTRYVSGQVCAFG